MTAYAAAAALWIAALVPGLVAVNRPPSPTLFNQAAAWAAWGLVATYGVRAVVRPLRPALAMSGWLVLALMLVALAAFASMTFGGLPSGLAASSMFTAAAAATVVLLGSAVAPTPQLLRCWFGALFTAGLLGTAIGILQVFAPDLADGEWIARSGVPGRAVGNLRQPNHLASVLLWATVAVVPLVESGWLARSATRRVASVVGLSLLMLGVMLTGSRTGVVGALVLAMWGLLDRSLSRQSRALLLSAPLLFALAWWLVGLWVAAQSGAVVGAATRLGDEDLSTGRFAIWRDSLTLLAAQPWWGVGFGEFNMAWTLTPFSARSPQFFDHTHNLPLQLLVELGVPLGLTVLALLAWSLWQAWDRARRVDGAVGAALRAMFVLVLLMGLHSQLEYPLWYAHFLLPTAFAWGLCLGAGAAAPAMADSPVRWPLAAGVGLVAGAALMLSDYQRVSTIFSPPDDATPLEARILDGQRSWLFAHHADYARITALEEIVPPIPDEFSRSSHFLLDTRLLTAWANAYAREGDIERARWLADRLRELRQDNAAPFFAPCSIPALPIKPFQCTPASRSFTWRDFK